MMILVHRLGDDEQTVGDLMALDLSQSEVEQTQKVGCRCSVCCGNQNVSIPTNRFIWLHRRFVCVCVRAVCLSRFVCVNVNILERKHLRMRRYRYTNGFICYRCVL